VSQIETFDPVEEYRKLGTGAPSPSQPKPFDPVEEYRKLNQQERAQTVKWSGSPQQPGPSTDQDFEGAVGMGPTISQPTEAGMANDAVRRMVESPFRQEPPQPQPAPTPLNPNSILAAAGRTKDAQALADQAGFLGRTSAAVRTSVGGGLDAATENTRRAVNATGGRMPPSRYTRLSGDFTNQQIPPVTVGSEMMGVDDKTRQIAEHAGAIPTIIGGAAGVVPSLLDPAAIGPLKLSGAAEGLAARETAGAAFNPAGDLLAHIATKNPAAARTVSGILQGQRGVGTFAGLHAAASYPNWDTDPQGGIEAVKQATEGGIEAGSVFGLAHAAPAALGDAAAARTAARVQERTDSAQTYQDAMTRGRAQGPTAEPQALPQGSQPTPNDTADTFRLEQYAQQKEAEAAAVPPPPTPPVPRGTYTPPTDSSTLTGPPRPTTGALAKEWIQQKRQQARDRVAEQIQPKQAEPTPIPPPEQTSLDKIVDAEDAAGVPQKDRTRPAIRLRDGTVLTGPPGGFHADIREINVSDPRIESFGAADKSGKYTALEGFEHDYVPEDQNPTQEPPSVPQPEEKEVPSVRGQEPQGQEASPGPGTGAKAVPEEGRIPDAQRPLRDDRAGDAGAEAGQAVSAEVLKTEEPTPAAKQPPSKPLTKQAIEKALVQKHQDITGGDQGYKPPGWEDDDAQTISGSFFNKNAPGDLAESERALTPKQVHALLPTEIREAFTPEEARKAGFQVTNKTGQASGEDTAYDIGWDEYIDHFREQATGELSPSKVNKAKKFFRDNPHDPEASLLSALHDKLGPGKRVLTKMGMVEPSKIKEGDTFKIGGVPVRVVKEGEYLIIKDGEDLPETPVEALNKVPMDKGSMGAKEETTNERTPKPDVKPDARPADAEREAAKPEHIEKAVPARPAPAESTPGKDGPAQGDSGAAEPPRAEDRGRAPADGEPNTIGLSKAEQDRIRSETGLSELPDHERRGWEEVLDNAKRKKLDEDALIVAERVRKTGEQMTDEEHAGAVLKAADLANRYDEKIELAAKLVERGEHEAAKSARKDADTIIDQIGTLTEATRNSRRETARALAIGRMMVNRESMKLADVMTRATEAKGEKLTSKEREQLESLTRLYESQAKRLGEAEKLIQKQKTENEKLRAGQAVRRAAIRSEANARTDVKRQRLKIERNDILNDLRKIGIRTNEVVGASAEALYHVGRLALNIAKEGALTLEEVVAKVKEHIPDITDEEVIRSLNAKDPSRQAKARTEAMRRVEAIKKEAKDLERLAAQAERLAAEKPIKSMEAEARMRAEQIAQGEKAAADAARKQARADKKSEEQANAAADRAVKEWRRQDEQRAKNEARQQEIENRRTLRKTTQEAERTAKAEANRRARADAAQMQMVLTQLRTSLYKTTKDAATLERAGKLVNQLQDNLANHARELRKPPTPEATGRLAEIRTQIAELRKTMKVEDTLADLNSQLESGDFKITVRPEVPIDPALERMQIEVKKARQNIRRAIEDMRPKTKLQRVDEGLNFLRTMKATADLSYALRQGAMLSARRPITAIKTFGKAFQAALSEAKAEQIDHQIRNHPNQFLRDKAGLYLAELDKGPLKGHEEAFMSSLAEKIPIFGKVVKASERNMVTGLNLLRTAAFDGFLERHPNATTVELKAWADYVNKASGRGNLGQSAGAARLLSSVFFAPRFAISRFQAPAALIQNMSKPRVRAEIAKDMAAFVGTGMTALGLAYLAGARVSMNPRDPDFGKIRFGDTRVDIWGGEQQAVRLIAGAATNIYDRAELAAGRSTPSNAERVAIERYSPLEAFGRFASFKLAPSITVPMELWTGKDITGQPTTRTKTLATAALPLLYQDIYDAYQSEGAGAAIGTAAGGAVGLGVSTYPDSEAQTRKKYLDLREQGDKSEAARIRIQWNRAHPDNKISENFTGEPKPKKK
jgi:hypothetical protein